MRNILSKINGNGINMEITNSLFSSKGSRYDDELFPLAARDKTVNLVRRPLVQGDPFYTTLRRT